MTVQVADDLAIRTAPGPVLGTERIGSMDVLRGVAVLGILLMNITGFAPPFQASFDPSAAGGHTGVNQWVGNQRRALRGQDAGDLLDAVRCRDARLDVALE